MISSTAFGAPFESGGDSHKSYRFQDLKRFPGCEELSKYQSLSFEFNPLSSLKTLPSLEGLRKLCLDGTKISSFKGAAYQPMLSRISFVNTPLSKADNLAIMTYIVFGDHIRNVNGIPLTTDEINTAETYKKSLRIFLIKGYLITKMSPMTLHNQKNGDTLYPLSKDKSNKSLHSNNSLKRHKNNSANRSYTCLAPPLIKLVESEDLFIQETRELLAPTTTQKHRVFKIVSKNSQQTIYHTDKPKYTKKSAQRKLAPQKKEKIKTTEDAKIDLFLGDDKNSIKTLEIGSLNLNREKTKSTEITRESVLELTVEDPKNIKHTPPPKLKFTQNGWSDDETIELILTKKEAYELFYRKHLDVITTPVQADEFVKELMHSQKNRRK